MKKIFIFLFLLASASCFAQLRLVGTTGGWTTVDANTYTASFTRQTDLTGNSYTAATIVAGYRVVSATAANGVETALKLYEITAVANPTSSTIDLTVDEYGATDGAPTGQVFIFNPDGRMLIPQIPTGSTGATAAMQAAIDTYNARYAFSMKLTNGTPSGTPAANTPEVAQDTSSAGGNALWRWNGSAWVSVSGLMSGTAAGGDLTGTYPNPTITTNAVGTAEITDGTVAWADLATPVSDTAAAHRTDINNLQTLSGRPDGSTHNSTYTGATIPDNQTTKQNLQSIETAIEGALNKDISTLGYNNITGVLTATLTDATTKTTIIKEVGIYTAAPTGTPAYPFAIDTVGTDTIYVANNGAWVRFSAGGGGSGVDETASQGILDSANVIQFGNPTSVTNTADRLLSNRFLPLNGKNLLFGDATNNLLFISGANDNIGVGTTTVSAKLHSLSTTEQLRLGYDASNYVPFTVSSGGDLTLSPTGKQTGLGLTPSGNFNLEVGGTSAVADRKIGINGTQVVYLPDQAGSAFTSSIFFGNGGGSLSHSSGIDAFNNTAVGVGAMLSMTTGYYNTAVGADALRTNTTGNENNAWGAGALYANTSGSFNCALGNVALRFNTTGTHNVGVGNSALYGNTTGLYNVGIGYQSLYANTTGRSNTAIGYVALGDLNITNNTGNNTAVGYDTGKGIVTGTGNTILGANVTGLSSALTNTVIIADGTGAQRIVATSTGVGIGGTTSPSYALDIGGTGGMRLNVGTTAQRPTGAAGVFRYNSTLLNTEFHDGSAWRTSVDGSGTATYIPKWNGTNTLANSLIQEVSSTKILIGTTAAVSTVTPLILSLGGTYGGSTAGNVANMKLLFHDDGTPANSYGIGVSGSLFELQTTTDFAFFTGLVAQRTERVRINSSGLTVVDRVFTGNGTTALSAIAPSGDTDSGISFTTANQVDINVGGSQKLWVTSTGLGVGMTPTTAFQVSGSIKQNASAGATGFLSANGSNLASSSGINPGIAFYNDGSNLYGMSLGYHSATSRFSIQTIIPSGADFVVATASGVPSAQSGITPVFVVQGTGKVGIGTPSPTSWLHVAGNMTASAWGVAGIHFNAAAATFTDNSTAASGTATNAVANSLGIPTFAASNATVTMTNAANLYIAGAAAAGTNVTLTNAYALWVDAGSSRFDGEINLNGSAGTSGQFLRSAGTGAVPTWTDAIAGTISTGQVAVGSGTNTISGSANLTYVSSVLGLASSIFSTSGNQTLAAWGLNGAQIRATAATYTDNSTAASGTATNAMFTSLGIPTLAATNATVTTTNAATLYIAGAVAAGTNQTITNSWALFIDAGNVRIDGTIRADNGSASAPPYAFITASTYGMFQGASALKFTTDGVEKFAISDVGNFSQQSTTTATNALTIREDHTITSTGTTASGFGLSETRTLEIPSGSTVIGAQRDVVLVDDSAGLEDVSLVYKVRKGGTLTTALTIGGSVISTNRLTATELHLDKTITAAATTGAQTINKPMGSVNFAAAATSLVVTNSLVSTSSIILATVATNDSTMKTVAVVAAGGSFTIHANAAATAETRVNFIVLN